MPPPALGVPEKSGGLSVIELLKQAAAKQAALKIKAEEPSDEDSDSSPGPGSPDTEQTPSSPGSPTPPARRGPPSLSPNPRPSASPSPPSKSKQPLIKQRRRAVGRLSAMGLDPARRQSMMSLLKAHEHDNEDVKDPEVRDLDEEHRAQTCASKCRVIGPGLENSCTRKVATFNIEAVDRIGRPQSHGGDNFIVVVRGRGTVLRTRVNDREDGHYVVEYKPQVCRVTLTHTEPPPSFCLRSDPCFPLLLTYAAVRQVPHHHTIRR